MSHGCFGPIAVAFAQCQVTVIVVCYSLRGLAALLVFSLVRLLIAVAGFHFVNRNSSRNLQT
jgi:hypothetical protein